MMSPRDAAFVACRLLALYFLYRVVQWLPHLYSLDSGTLFVVLRSPDEAGAGAVSAYTRLVLDFCTTLLPMLFFWFGADWLSKRIYPSEKAIDHQQKWDREAVLSVVTVATGLVIVLQSIMTFANWIYISQLKLDTTMLWSAGVIIDLPETILSFVVGCLFIIGAGSIARFVIKLRRW